MLAYQHPSEKLPQPPVESNVLGCYYPICMRMHTHVELRRLIEKLVISRVTPPPLTPTLHMTYDGAPCDSEAVSA
jgi:hypothetical protein